MAEILTQILDHPAKTVLTLHRKPDGDSIGSNIALYRTLVKRGHDVVIFSRDNVPDKFSFLPDVKNIQTCPPLDIPWRKFDRYIALDMGGPEMLGEEVQKTPIKFPKKLEITTIDHHYTNKGWGKKNIIEADAISAASVLLHEFDSSGVEVDPVTATALLTGIATDSGFFKFNSDADPFDQASTLIKKGADYAKIIDAILSRIPIADIKFIQESLARLTFEEFSPGKNAAILPIDYDLWTNVGVSPDKNVHLLGYIANAEGSTFGALLTEEQPGEIRVELRTRDKDFDVSKIALALRGGGHKKAAGARLSNISLAEVKEKIFAVL